MTWWTERRAFEEINEKLDTLLAAAGVTLRRQRLMAQDLDGILTTVTNQKGQIASIKTLVVELKAHQNDPAKLAEIVAALDENTVELAVIANPDEPPAEPTA